MITPATQAILASALSSVLGLLGGFLLLWRYQAIKKIATYLVSFAAGTMLGAAFFDVLAEAIEKYPTSVTFTFGWVMGGFLLFFLIEKLLLWHHHSHGDEDHHDRKILAPLVIIGDSVHNFIDGTIIAAAFLVNPSVGVVTALAVFLHEIPQEIGNFSIMIHGGMSRYRVAWWNFLGALISPIGAILTILLASRVEGLELPLLGLAAGNFIYIAAADLVPEIHRERRTGKMIGETALLVAGLLMVILLTQFFPG